MLVNDPVGENTIEEASPEPVLIEAIASSGPQRESYEKYRDSQFGLRIASSVANA